MIIIATLIIVLILLSISATMLASFLKEGPNSPVDYNSYSPADNIGTPEPDPTGDISKQQTMSELVKLEDNPIRDLPKTDQPLPWIPRNQLISR